MTIKVHFLHSHRDKFPDNCDDVSDELRERFLKGIKTMEEHYQKWWYKRIMTDYCWSIKRDFVLHIDPWPSRLSEILCAGRTCENKQKQSHGWTEIYGCYEMIYAGAHVRYRKWSLSLESVSSLRREENGQWLERSTQRSRVGLQLSIPWLRKRRSAKWGLEDNTACYGQEKKKLWVSMPVCLHVPLSLSVSHTPTEA